MTHGWPGSVIELLEAVGPLTDPTAHGGSAEDAFDLVLPSLPGYGFSAEPTELGWDAGRVAQAWAELMHRLGYTRYVAQGGDVGAAVTDAMGRQAPEGLAGIHMNLLVTALGGGATPAEHRAGTRGARRDSPTFRATGFGYFLEQATRPQTIGYALLDSPVALAAWMLDHDTDSYYKISRAFVDGQPAGHLTRDHILDNITLYWLTGTGASAARSYWESGRAQALAAGQAPPPVTAPGRLHHVPRRDLPGPAQLGRAGATPPSPTSTRPTRAATSPPGKSPNCSRPRSGPRSSRCANDSPHPSWTATPGAPRSHTGGAARILAGSGSGTARRGYEPAPPAQSVTATAACRDEADVQLAGNDRGLAGGADVTATPGRLVQDHGRSTRRMTIRSRQHGHPAHCDRRPELGGSARVLLNFPYSLGVMSGRGAGAPGSCVFLCPGDLDRDQPDRHRWRTVRHARWTRIPASRRSRAALTAASEDIRRGRRLPGLRYRGGGLTQRVSPSQVPAVGTSPAARATRWEARWPGWRWAAGPAWPPRSTAHPRGWPRSWPRTPRSEARREPRPGSRTSSFQVVDGVQADGPRGPGQQAGQHHRERVSGFFRPRMAGLLSWSAGHLSSWVKICRKNRNTFRMSRKIDAASNGADRTSVLVRARWKSKRVNPAKITRPSAE